MKEACDNLCSKCLKQNIIMWHFEVAKEKKSWQMKDSNDDSNPCDRHCYQKFLVLKYVDMIE